MRKTIKHKTCFSETINMDTHDDHEIIVPMDGEDYFNKRIKIRILSKEKYLKECSTETDELSSHQFPNALMIKDTIFEKKGSLFDNSTTDGSVLETNKIVTDKQHIETIPAATDANIWDILNKIKTVEHPNPTTVVKDKKVCKNCGEKDSFTEDPYASIIVCLNCGMVSDEIIDSNPEWRSYNNDDSRGDTVTRCGGPSSYFFPQSSQGTTIAGYSNNRLNRKQKWISTDYKERNLTKEFEFITQICLANGIKKYIIDTAKIMYKKISDCKHKTGKNAGDSMITRGDNRISVMAVCVSKACETNRKPRSNGDIAKMFGIAETRLTKGFSTFEDMKENCDDSYIFEQLHSSTTDDFIRCCCEDLNISKQDTNLAVKIAFNCNKLKLATNHNARSLAAGVILTMVEYSDLDIERKSIAGRLKTSPTTINKIYSELMPYIDALVDDAVTDHIVKKFGINGP